MSSGWEEDNIIDDKSKSTTDEKLIEEAAAISYQSFSDDVMTYHSVTRGFIETSIEEVDEEKESNEEDDEDGIETVADPETGSRQHDNRTQYG